MLLMRRILASTAVAAVLVVGLVSVAAAATDGNTAGNDSTATEAEVPAAAVADSDSFEGFEDWVPTAEELAEINADTDALVEYLRGLGFEVTVATDELGFRYVDFDESTDESILAAMDDFYAARLADEAADWSVEEKAQWNAWIDEFVAELAAEGVTVETEEIAPGVYDIVWTEGLEKALMDIDGDLPPEGPFDGEGFGVWEPSAEEIADINTETDALVEYLQDRGFAVTVATDELGLRYIDSGETDDDQDFFAAMDDFYQAQFAAEVAGWSDAEKAEWNAGVDALVAELAADGLTVETEEVAPGIYDIVWTDALDETLMGLEGDLFGDFEDWEPSTEELAAINADTDALVDYLQDLGFEVTVATDELGFRYVDFDQSVDEAVFAAIDDFYRVQFTDEVAGWSDAEKAEWNAGIDAFVAELAAVGIAVETEEIASGVYDIVWSDELDESLMRLEGDHILGDFEDVPFDELEQSA